MDHEAVSFKRLFLFSESQYNNTEPNVTVPY